MKIKHITQIFILIAAMMLFTAPCYAAYDPSLVGYWKFDETAGGTAYDSTTNDNDGTINGNPTLGATGQYGTAFNFDGDGDYIAASDADSLDVSVFTLSAWIKLDDIDTDAQRILSKRIYGSSGSNFDLLYHGTVNRNRLKLYVGEYGVGGNSMMSNVDTITDTEWHHVLVTYDNSDRSYQFYIDGVGAGSGNGATVLTTITNDADLLIGLYASGYFIGTIDEVAIWNKTLNWDQAEFVYDHGVEYFEERGQAPEPSSMLFALAGVGFAIKKRRRA